MSKNLARRLFSSSVSLDGLETANGWLTYLMYSKTKAVVRELYLYRAFFLPISGVKTGGKFRSSRPEVFRKKDVVKILQNSQ